jgi:dihydroflavonol-4-reductase
MNVLVSGATGFVGGTIARHLLAAGHSVRAISRSAEKAQEPFASPAEGRAARAPGRLTVASADVTRPQTLRGVVHGVQAVVQAAQFTGARV